MVGQSKSWDDVLLQEREENTRLRQQQRDQAERERRLVQRLAQLKEQQVALQGGKTVDAVDRDGKIKALQDQLANLNRQHKDLEAKLQAAKAGNKGPHASTTASVGLKGASRPASASRGGHLDNGDAAGKVEELKRKLLETNRQIKQLEEKHKTSDLISTLDLYQSEIGGEGSGIAEREELRRELKLKEAKYTVAKNEFDKLDKEYKEYVEKHKQLEQQAQNIQEEILKQEKQKRDIEREIKQMRLERDADSDQKNILADLKEELALLKEENKQLNQDSMSGKTLQEKQKVQDQEVVRLREENDILFKSIEEQQERKERLDKRLQDAQKQQKILAKEVADKGKEVEELNRDHKELVSKLRDFSVDPDSAISGAHRPQTNQEQVAGKADGSDDLVVQACTAMNEQLMSRNISADAAFKSWDTNADDLLSQDEFVEGVMQLRAGLQRDEARQLFVLIKGDAEQLTQAKFGLFLGKAAGDSALAVGSEESEVLEGELRKLRTLNAQLLKEKDEVFQSLREAERARKAQAAGGELAQAERLLEIEQMHAAQLRKLQDDLAVAQYNQQDLLQLIGSYEDSRVRKPGAPSVARGGPGARNVVVIEITALRLDSACAGMQEEPTTFFSVDFFAHETQVTPPCTGFDVDIAWSCEFEVEEDDLFLGYLDTDAMNLELMQRVNEDTPFKRLASSRVSLKGLLDRASLVNQPIDLIAPNGQKLGQAFLHIRMKNSIFESVERYRRSERSKMQSDADDTSSSVLEALGVPLDKIQLVVTIEKCEGLRASRYGALPWPYCQYELPISMSEEEERETHATETRTKEANPVFNDRKVWDIPDAKLALALRKEELQVFVFDDNDQEELSPPYLGFAKLRLAPIFIAPAQPLKTTLVLEGSSSGIKNGTLTLTVEWCTPAAVQAAKQKKALALQQASGAATSKAADSSAAVGASTAGQVVRKTWTRRKVSAAKVEGAEAEWLEMLRNKVKEVGHSADKVFLSFDKDADGELSFDDFKESMDGEQLGLSGDQIRKLFEFISGSSDKNISKARFCDAVSPGTFGILPADQKHLVLLYRQLTFQKQSPMWEEIVKEKGKTRFAIVTDWFTQPQEEILSSTSAKSLLITARRGTTEFSHKEVYRMDQRENRARVEKILENEGSSDKDWIEIILCKVTNEGKVLLDDYVAKASLDIKSILKDKADLSEHNVQLESSQGKGVATLSLDSGMLESLSKLSTGGVGAVPDKMTDVDWEATVTLKLANLLGSKGVSATDSFERFDENCDDEIDWEEFQSGIRSEPLDLDDQGRRRLFDYLCAGKKTIDKATWKSKLSSSAVSASGVVTAQEAKQAIVLVVKSAKVHDSVLKARKIKKLSVRVDFTRQPNAKIRSTESRPLKEGSLSVELNDTLVMSLRADGSDAEATTHRKHLLDAFAVKAQVEAKIDMILIGQADEGAGKMREFELGVYTLDLKKLYRDGDDLQDFTIMPEDNGAAVGKVVLSLFFMQALKGLNVDGKSSDRPGGAGGGRGGGGVDGGSVGGSGGADGGSGGTGPAGSGTGLGRRRSSTGKPRTPRTTGEGHLSLNFSELKLEGSHSLASDDKVQNVFLSANFLGLQSDREVAKIRSSSIPLDELRADKAKTKAISHVAKFNVDDALYAANRNALSKVLSADENPKTGLISVLLYRSLMQSEYNENDAVEIARGDVSINDLLHASLVEDDKEYHSLPLSDKDGALVATCKISMDFNQVNLHEVKGHSPFAKDEFEKNIVIHFRKLQTVSSAKLRGVASFAVGVKLAGGSQIVEGSRSRAIHTKDMTAGGHPRGDLCLNHKVLLPLSGFEVLRQSLLDKKNTPIKLILLNAGDDSEIAECDIDLKRDIIDKSEDFAKKEVLFMDFDGSTRVVKGVVDIALLCALHPLQASGPSTSAHTSASGSAISRPPTEMSLVVDKVDIDKKYLAEDLKYKKLLVQVKWFGAKEERSTGYAPAASLPLRHEFKLDVASEHDNTTFKDRVSEALAKETVKGGAENVQISLVAQLDGAGADRIVASGTIDIAAMLFEGQGDGAREIYLVEGSEASASATTSATSGTKLGVTIHFRRALGSIAVRMSGRQSRGTKDAGGSCVMNRKEGSQVSSETEKLSNFILSIKGVDLTSTAMDNTTAAYHGPLFLAVDFFGEESDDAAIGGSEGYLRQQRLPISERFLCPVDSEHESNRKRLKEALEKKDMTVTINLFSEPWKSGARALASGTLASTEFLSREGADMQVHLKDEETKIASVICNVYSQGAMKMLGL